MLMDVQKIGAFIADQRRQKQMTQKQLGEALGVSDKTVSKWECGYGLPDISMIMPLCAQLEINVNELLSGEQLAQEEYHEKAEENMMHLIQESNHQKKKNIRTNMLGAVCMIGIAGFFLSVLKYYDVKDIFYTRMTDWFLFSEIIFIMVLSLWTAGQITDFRHAFLYLIKNAKNPQELKLSIMAVSAAQRTLLFAGILCSVFDWTRALSSPVFEMEDLFVIQHNLSVALNALFYGVFAALLLESVKCRLKKKQLKIKDDYSGSRDVSIVKM